MRVGNPNWFAKVDLMKFQCIIKYNNYGEI
jgi:hypothetical protein